MAKYQKYAEYKDSGIEWLGAIPSHWRLFALKRSIDKCTNGFWGAEPDGVNDLCVLRVADFNRDNFEINLDKLTYRSVLPKEAESRLLKNGDLLIEKSGGGEKTLVGCVVQFDKDFPAITSNFVAKMTPNSNMYSRFLTYSFAHLYAGRVNYPAIKQTTGIQNLDSEAYLMESFCFPPAIEQTQIANFLDYETAKIDNLIAKQKKLIELLKEKRQAVVSHAVTKGLNPNVPMKDSGSLWTTQIPSHWKLTKLTYVARIGNGATPSRDNEAYWKDGSIGWINSSKVNDVIITEADQFITPLAKNQTSVQVVQPTDLVMAITGEGQTRGRIAICQLDATINQHLASIRITDKNLNHEFLFYWLTANYERIRYESTGAGSTKGAITCGDIGLYPVPLPPYQEQLEIVASIKKQSETFKSLVAKAESAIQLMQERRIALISAAVTGKIDVRHHASRPTGNYKMQTEVV